jgi:tetratricopeptide (TPR) repeat protein
MNNPRETDDLLAALNRARELDHSGRDLVAARDLIAAAEAWEQSAAALRDAADTITLRLAEMLERTAALSVHAGRPETGRALAGEAVARLRCARATGSAQVEPLAARLGSVGQLYCVMQRWADAAEILAEANGWFGDAAPQGPRLQMLDALGAAYRFSGRPARAIALLEEAVDRAVLIDQTFADRLELARLRNTLGQVLLENGRPDAAISALQQCLADANRLASEQAVPEIRNLQAAALNRLGHAHAALQRRSEAVSYFEQSVALMRALVEDEGLAALADDLRTALDDLQRLESRP